MALDKIFFSKLMTGFGFFMVAIFFLMGFALIFLPVYEYLPRNIKYIFGFFFIAYGLFRFARLFQQIRQQKRKENNNE